MELVTTTQNSMHDLPYSHCEIFEYFLNKILFFSTPSVPMKECNFLPFRYSNKSAHIPLLDTTPPQSSTYCYTMKVCSFSLAACSIWNLCQIVLFLVKLSSHSYFIDMFCQINVLSSCSSKWLVMHFSKSSSNIFYACVSMNFVMRFSWMNIDHHHLCGCVSFDWLKVFFFCQLWKQRNSELSEFAYSILSTSVILSSFVFPP